MNAVGSATMTCRARLIERNIVNSTRKMPTSDTRNRTKIVRDADMLRNKAVVVNEDGTERLVNPMLLNASMRTRLSVLDTWLSAMNEFYNLEKLQELYKLIIDEVGKADPEAQQAILARLRQLNNERGLTMAARL